MRAWTGATIVAATLAVGACTSTPTREAAPTPSPTTASPSPTPTPDADRLILLPPECRDDQVTVDPRPGGEGATGHDISWWRVRLVHGPACILWGRPRVLVLDAAGKPLPFHYAGAGRVGAPVLVTARKPATVMTDKYRCDLSTLPVESASALITLPGTTTAHPVRTRGGFPVCGADDPSHTVVVLDVRDGRRLDPPYAVSMRTRHDPGHRPTWGRADVDGDGTPDLVTVTRAGDIAVSFADGAQTVALPADPTLRLQGLSDLDGDGRAEILVARSAAGCCGDRPVSMTTRVVRMVGDRLRAMRSDLGFSRGRGDVAAGVACHDGRITLLEATATGPSSWQLLRTTYRLDRTRLDHVGFRAETLTGGLDAALAATRTSCPGLDADGWAR